jgi:hypothetical protein
MSCDTERFERLFLVPFSGVPCASSRDTTQAPRCVGLRVWLPSDRIVVSHDSRPYCRICAGRIVGVDAEKAPQMGSLLGRVLGLLVLVLLNVATQQNATVLIKDARAFFEFDLERVSTDPWFAVI